MSVPKNYRKKPVVVQAVQWDGTAEGASPVIDWILFGGGTARYTHTGEEGEGRRRSEYELVSGHYVLRKDAPAFLSIDTLEGLMRADVGDFIIRGIKGEHYPCKSDIFEQTYEEVSE